MMFSDRTNWPRQENELSRAWRQARQRGDPTVDLTVSNPTRCGFSYPQEEILAALGAPADMVYTPDALGLLPARQAVADHYARQGVAVDPRQVVLTSSTSEAYSLLFRLVANPGDQVLFPRPSYPLFRFLADLNDLDARSYDLIFQDRWRLDARSLDEAWTAETKAAVLVNPNNPTGSYLDREGLSAVVSRARHYQTAVICDEVFSEFSLSGDGRSRSLAGMSDVLTFVLSGLSKVLGLPQMKLSWMIVSGPDGAKREALQRLEIMADTYLSVNTPSQRALPQWLGLAPRIREMILARLQGNLNTLRSVLADIPGARVLPPQGGWYAVIRVDGHVNEEEFCLRLLREKHVYLHPGYFFDFLTPGHLVVSLLTEQDVFLDGVRSLAQGLVRL